MIIIHPRVTSKSAGRLAKALGVKSYGPKDFIPVDARKELIFNYGYSQAPVDLRGLNVINPEYAVQLSVNKILTYKVLQANLIPTVTYVENEDYINPKWPWVVCRSTVTGRNCEGVMITRPNDIVKGCPLYTKFFNHDAEYRIVVFKNNVIARYRKANLQDGQYDLEYMLPDGFNYIDEAAIEAAKAIGLDYAGIDILSNEKSGAFVVLEANSGPLLTDETEEALVNLLK